MRARVIPSFIGAIRPSAAIVCATACLLIAVQDGHAHETGRKVTVPLQTRQIQSPSGVYQVAFACLPSSAATGELVACEVKVVPPGPSELSMEIREASRRVSLPIHQEGRPGVYGTEYRFPSAGPYNIDVRVGRDPPLTFSMTIVPGLIERLRWLSVVAILGAAAWGIWRLFQRAAASRGRVDFRAAAQGVIYIAATLITMAVVDRAIVPAFGRSILPLRSNGDVDWGALEEEPREQAGEASSSPASTPIHGSGDAASTESSEWTGRVVPRPGAVADVFVPMTGRVVFTKEFVPRIGAHVRAGQTLVLLEHHYVLHDAVHLINERWPILLDRLAAKRLMFETAVASEKAQFLYARNSVSLKSVKDSETAAAVAANQFERARADLEKHDAQIRESDLVTRPLVCPLSGTISSATFTRGQLVYEGDKLFTIADTSSVWVRVDVPEQLAAEAARSFHQPRFSTPALGDETFGGRFVKTGAVVDQATRTVPFFFGVGNDDKRLKLGMMISIQFRPTANVGVTSAPRDDTPGHAVRAPAVIAADAAGQADVTAPIWGRIEFADRPISVGDHVAKGQELVRLVLELPISERYAIETRQREISAALEESRRRKELAEFDYRRAVNLLKTNYSDPYLTKQVEWTEGIYRNADEEEAAITAQLTSYATVIKRRDPKVTPVSSPIAGVVTDIAFTPGDLDQTQEFRRLFTITDLRRVWIVADVFEKDVDVIRKCRVASFTPAGGSAQPLGAPLVIADSVDEKTRTLRVIFQVPNSSGALRLGASGTVTFEAE